MPEVYLHVSNGGVTFKVYRDPESGPVIEIDQSQFGAVENKLTIKTNPQSIMELARMFFQATSIDWGPPPALKHYFRGQVGDPWDDHPRATVQAKYVPNPEDPSREWVHIGGDLEASYDGSVYVDVRVRGDKQARFFISKPALKAAIQLFRTTPAQRVAAAWLARKAAQETVTKQYEFTMTPEVKDRFESFLALMHYNGGHSATFGMSFDGDGADLLRVKPAPPEKYRKAVSGIGNAGGGLERANSDGSYTAINLDYDRPTWSIEPGQDEPTKDKADE